MIPVHLLWCAFAVNRRAYVISSTCAYVAHDLLKYASYYFGRSRYGVELPKSFSAFVASEMPEEVHPQGIRTTCTTRFALINDKVKGLCSGRHFNTIVK